MKKKSVSRRSPSNRDDLKSEYRFDYAKAKPNRFASKMSEDTVAVVLDPDVAVIFKSSDSVNELLRSVIAAMPEPKPKRAG
jgi:hypothetical protein